MKAMKKISQAGIVSLLCVCTGFFLRAAGAVEPDPSPLRPAQWAVPIQKPGLPNLHRVSETLYRGAQPTADGMKNLEAMGIKTVVNLRALHSDSDELKGTSLLSSRIYFKTWHPEEEDIVAFLKIVTDPNRQPVFVHCQHGADRTGMMVAMVRMAVQGWSKEEAIREMTEGGFGFHPIWQNIVEFVKKTDVERIRKLAGIQSPDR
jgi:protein tyrosine/serine phosphatase